MPYSPYILFYFYLLCSCLPTLWINTYLFIMPCSLESVWTLGILLNIKYESKEPQAKVYPEVSSQWGVPKIFMFFIHKWFISEIWVNFSECFIWILDKTKKFLTLKCYYFKQQPCLFIQPHFQKVLGFSCEIYQ